VEFPLQEWLNLAVRWAHVFAAILWVGQTYFFTWLDGRFADDARVWMVHSGGFYVVDRQKVPERMPAHLHWFRWEAAATWGTGAILLVSMYWAGSGLVEDASGLSHGAAVMIAASVLVAGWLAYDLASRSPLGRSLPLFAAASLAAIAAVAFALSRVFGGRAAYIHVGAMFGTIMAANVWLRILPAQRRMVEALEAGRAPDEQLAARAKMRSKHNTFLAVPVVFLMISNHFPVATYGNRHGWLVLTALVAAGWWAAKVIRRA
jgi:uncharacterized membrane protein